jgi:hypothetical protein
MDGRVLTTDARASAPSFPVTLSKRLAVIMKIHIISLNFGESSLATNAAGERASPRNSDGVVPKPGASRTEEITWDIPQNLKARQR